MSCRTGVVREPKAVSRGVEALPRFALCAAPAERRSSEGEEGEERGGEERRER